MHFDKMSEVQKELYLYKIHKAINKDFFKGELNDVLMATPPPDVWGVTDNIAAAFKREYLPYYCEAILFNSDFLEILNEQRVKSGNKKQTLFEERYNLLVTMLHEMVHQYCYENGIDDGNHNENFQRVAAERGLVLEWISDTEYTEKLTLEAELGLNMIARSIYFNDNYTEKMKKSYRTILKKFVPEDFANCLG